MSVVVFGRQLLCLLFKKARTNKLFVSAIAFIWAILVFIRIQNTPSPRFEWANFSLTLPYVEPIISRGHRQLYLAVVVNSGASGEKHRVLRKTIRNTWGNSSITPYRNKTWMLFFVLGVSVKHTEHEKNLQEAFHNNDVIIGNFTDDYKSLILKTFMSHFWVTSKLSSCKYVLKADDDVYIRIPKLLQWLEEAGSPHPFYGGYVGLNQTTVRDPTSKWFLAKEQFDEKYWPPFCHGAFHVLSTDILPRYFNYTKYRRRPFHTDDAYLGVVARDLGVVATQIQGFNLQFIVKPRSNCELLSSIALGHKVEHRTMLRYYNFYKTQTAKCHVSTLTGFSTTLTGFSTTLIMLLFLLETCIV